jgi:transcriptional regulator with XRE-family HTH domain
MEISEENFIINFGTHLRQLREKKNLSQQDLADDCNVPKSQIARIERAKINTTLRTLIKIANALQIELNELLTLNTKE